MANRQDWYLGQVVNEGEMDTIYDDLIAAERFLAVEGAMSQDPDPANALQYGGILSGLVVTKNAVDKVNVSFGTARDGFGKRINVNAGSGANSVATVSLTNLGDTEEGLSIDAVGDGSLVATSITAGEAWLSLFAAFDTNLSDIRVDALNNQISFRQLESFHFEILVGTDAAPPATARAPLASTRVLLADILLDNNGEIRTLYTYDAICGSSRDYDNIRYSSDYTANLGGRRADWVAIDTNDAGTTYTLLKNSYDSSRDSTHAYHSIRAGSPREAIKQLIELYAEPGTASVAGGSEIIGGRPITGLTRASPTGAALQMPAGSIHDQLLALYNKVNTLLSRGDDTFTGTLTIVGSLVYTGDFEVGDGTPKQFKIEATSPHRVMFGRSASYPNGRTIVDSDGIFAFANGYTVAPENQAAAPASYFPNLVTLPTRAILENYDHQLQKNSVLNAAMLTAKGADMDVSFANYWAAIHTTDSVEIYPHTYLRKGGSAGATINVSAADAGRLLMDTGTAVATDYVQISTKAPFDINPGGSDAWMFHATFSLDDAVDNDVDIIIGMTDSAQAGSPPMTLTSGTNAVGLIFNFGSNFKFFVSNATSVYEEATAIAAASGPIFDFYLWALGGSSYIYWITGMTAVAAPSGGGSSMPAASALASAVASIRKNNAVATSYSLGLYRWGYKSNVLWTGGLS